MSQNARTINHGKTTGSLTGRQRDELRRQLAEAILANSRALDDVDPSSQPSKARGLLNRRRELRTQYQDLVEQ
jgi:hypothetical protein